MDRYEYAVIPAPSRGEKARGAKTSADRFSLTLTQVLNDMAARGWDYVRAETLPSEERSGLTGKQTVWNNVLVFRRAIGAAAVAPAPVPASQPEPLPRASEPEPEPAPVTPPPAPAPAPPPPPAPAEPQPKGTPFSEPMRTVAASDEPAGTQRA